MISNEILLLVHLLPRIFSKEKPSYEQLWGGGGNGVNNILHCSFFFSTLLFSHTHAHTSLSAPKKYHSFHKLLFISIYTHTLHHAMKIYLPITNNYYQIYIHLIICITTTKGSTRIVIARQNAHIQSSKFTFAHDILRNRGGTAILHRKGPIPHHGTRHAQYKFLLLELHGSDGGAVRLDIVN